MDEVAVPRNRLRMNSVHYTSLDESCLSLITLDSALMEDSCRLLDSSLRFRSVLPLNDTYDTTLTGRASGGGNTGIVHSSDHATVGTSSDGRNRWFQRSTDFPKMPERGSMHKIPSITSFISSEENSLPPGTTSARRGRRRHFRKTLQTNDEPYNHVPTSEEDMAARKIQSVVRLRSLQAPSPVSVDCDNSTTCSTSLSLPLEEEVDGPRHQHNDPSLSDSNVTRSRWALTSQDRFAPRGIKDSLSSETLGTLSQSNSVLASSDRFDSTASSGTSGERLDRLLPIAPIRQKSKLPFDGYFPRSGRGGGVMEGPTNNDVYRHMQRGTSSSSVFLDSDSITPDAGYYDDTRHSWLHDDTINSSLRFVTSTTDEKLSDIHNLRHHTGRTRIVDVGLTCPVRRTSLMRTTSSSSTASSMWQSSSSFVSSRRDSLPFPMGLFETPDRPEDADVFFINGSHSLDSSFFDVYDEDDDDDDDISTDDSIETTEFGVVKKNFEGLAESNSLHASSLWMSSCTMMMQSMDSSLHNSSICADYLTVPATTSSNGRCVAGTSSDDSSVDTEETTSKSMSTLIRTAPARRRGIFSEDRPNTPRRRRAIRPAPFTPTRSKSGLGRRSHHRGSMHSIVEDSEGDMSETHTLTAGGEISFQHFKQVKSPETNKLHVVCSDNDTDGNLEELPSLYLQAKAVSTGPIGGSSTMHCHAEAPCSPLAPALPQRQRSISTSSSSSSIRSNVL